MRKRNNGNGIEKGYSLACPHCHAGADGVTLGLYWAFNEHCWRCVICGYREFERARRPSTRTEIIAEKLWDEVLVALEKEEREKQSTLN